MIYGRMSFMSYCSAILRKCGLLTAFLLLGSTPDPTPEELRKTLLGKAAEFLDLYSISYVYGGRCSRAYRRGF